MNFVGEYIWFDDNHQFRSKTRTVETHNSLFAPEDWPKWNYDGSSTGQADGSFSEIILKPRCVVIDPFRRDSNSGFSKAFLILCDTYEADGVTPTACNKRMQANELFNKNLEAKPWYGIEQEYFMVDERTQKPLGFPAVGVPEPQGKYYCGVGNMKVYGRPLADKHYKMCLEAGLKISGLNAEVAPGQWEFQIGPCEGIQSGDHLWLARYLLVRLAENCDVSINFHPKPVSGQWNGSGCHTNYSTLPMRDGTENKTGLAHINDAIDKLSKVHDEHMAVYGSDNNLRMTGDYETSDYKTFSSGVANRGCSIRIPTDVKRECKGYFEDRRPSSNCDPYLVTSKIFDTTVLN
tara:strand:- start:20 stop:1066 length:1047 start_codon:yes stop_codon:yes gene_type:complete